MGANVQRCTTLYNAVMSKTTTGARLRLLEPLAGDLADFCEAHYGVEEIKIIRRALRAFIDAELKSDGAARERYSEARKKRLAGDRPQIHVVNGDKD